MLILLGIFSGKQFGEDRTMVRLEDDLPFASFAHGPQRAEPFHGQGGAATHSVLAAAVKHSPLLGDFLDIVVREQYRLFSTTLTNKLWADYLGGCREEPQGSAG
jgi:Putative inner membrane protein (DUF1819)